MKRLSYLDSLRGLAIVAMIINHVGHYLVSATSTSYANYLVVYLTVTWAAPLFLFVAGFSAAVTWQNKLATGETLKFDYFWRRGFFLYNFFCFSFFESPKKWSARCGFLFGSKETSNLCQYIF